MDIRPKKASPILNKKTKAKIPIAMDRPLLLKKLTKGPPILPLIQPAVLLPQYLSAFNNAIPKIPKISDTITKDNKILKKNTNTIKTKLKTKALRLIKKYDKPPTRIDIIM